MKNAEDAGGQPFAPLTGSAAGAVHLCPVCSGRGIVPNGFYSGTERQYSTTSVTPETCRACGGRGVIFTS